MSSICKHTVLSPVVTGALVYALTSGSQHARVQFLRRFDPETLTRTVKVLKFLFAFGLIRSANSLLNAWALNNWQLTRQEWVWDEEVAVVTGGSSGIGALVVEKLASKGLKVAVIDIQPLPEQLQNASNVAFFQCDITSPAEVKETAQSIKQALGAPSILFNNAGIAEARSILATQPDELRKLFDVNVLSHFYLIQAFLPDMIARKKGHIVSTASMASYVAVAGLGDYCASKSAVLSLHEALGQELKHRYRAPQIKTSVVHPIYVRTKLIASYAGSLRSSRATLLEPEVVADAVVKQILSGASGQIVLPGWMSAASSARGWPHWLQEMLRDSTRRDVDEEVK